MDSGREGDRLWRTMMHRIARAVRYDHDAIDPELTIKEE
jgi:hypothetical protein